LADHHDEWDSTISTIAASQYLGIPGKPGAWSDMDVLTTGGQGCHNNPNSSWHCPGQTDIEYQTEIAMWTMLQSPLFVATDVRNMTAVMKKTLLNYELFAIHQVL